MRVTLKAINKALKERGYPTELVRGDGYFYFTGEEASRFFFSGVYVAKLSELTLEEWLREYEEKRLTMVGVDYDKSDSISFNTVKRIVR